MMQGFKIIVLTLVIKLEILQAYCLYGDEKQCAFQCHCAVASECGNTTSECPSGCADGPLGHNWRGTGCQIGNIGYKKMADTSSFTNGYPASGAVDGIDPVYLEKGECCLPDDPDGKPADWWVNLGGLHRILQIIIFGRRDCCQERLQMFNINVYNTTDNTALCVYRHDVIQFFAALNCTEPRVGRFVQFIRVGGPEIHRTALCEVVIIGHKIIDCSKCPNGVACNEITGCAQCDGSYQPDCLTECEGDSYGFNCAGGCERGSKGKKCLSSNSECEDGSYGVNCGERCGKCKSGAVCDKTDGECPDGCEPGYYGEKCVDSCPINCMNNVCYNEGDCIDGCETGYNGTKCVDSCSVNCMNNVCYNEGDCTDGCKPGYVGKKCVDSCPINCINNVCSNEGDCTDGCKTGYYGPKCSGNWWIYPVVSAAIVFVAIAVYTIWKKKRNSEVSTDKTPLMSRTVKKQ